MPYKDPEKQKEAKRKYYRRKYAEDPDFVEAERQRKLAHYEANREERLPQMRAYSQEWYAKIERKRRKAQKTPAKKAVSSHGRRPAAKKTAAKAARKAVVKSRLKSVVKPKGRAAAPVAATRRKAVAAPVRTAVKAARPAVRPRSRSAATVKKSRPVVKRRK